MTLRDSWRDYKDRTRSARISGSLVRTPKEKPPCVSCTTTLQQYLTTPTSLCVVVRQQPCDNGVFSKSIWDHVGERTKRKKVQRIRTMLQTQNRKGEQTHPDMIPGPSQRLCWSSPWVETCQNTHTHTVLSNGEEGKKGQENDSMDQQQYVWGKTTKVSNVSLFCGTLEPTRMRWECGQVRVTRLRKGSNCAGVQRC